MEARPDEGPPHHFLAVLYEMTGKPKQAEEQYALAIDADSTLGEPKNNLAYLLAESGGDLDRALKLAQEAKAAMPESGSAADTLGWVLYKRGVPSAAVGYLREAVQTMDPGDPGLGIVRTHLSLAYEATGDLDKAIGTLETALSDLDQQRESASKAGKEVPEPGWASEARATIERLKSSREGATG